MPRRALPAVIGSAQKLNRHANDRAKKVSLSKAKERSSYVIQSGRTFSPNRTPNSRPRPQSPTLTPKTAKTPPTTPSPPIERIEHSELTTWKTFKSAHMKQAGKIDDYLHPGYGNRPSLGRATLADMEPRAALFLPFNNAFARVRYAWLMAEGLERLALSLPPGTPIFFVTLVNREHAVPLKDAAAFKLARVTGLVHQHLRGTSYVGMVEGAYFSNLDVLGPYHPKGISYHAHMALWGVSQVVVAALCRAINARYQPVVTGRGAADYRLLKPAEVFGQGLYMSKGQVREYRNWHRRQTLVDADTGEITKPITGRFGGGKRPLRLCDAVHLCEVFANRCVQEFSFAAGEGRAVLKAINRKALAEFHRWEARQPYKFAEEQRRAMRKAVRNGS